MFRITTPGDGRDGAAAPGTSPAPGFQARGEIPTPTIGRMLLEHGYNTSWLGKDHNVPAFQASQIGPFDPRPVGTGFEHFYGFVGGDANRTTATKKLRERISENR